MVKRLFYNERFPRFTSNQAKARMKVIHELLKEDSKNSSSLKKYVSKGVIDLREGERNNLKHFCYRKANPVINLD